MGVWRMWWWGYDNNSERRGASGNTPHPTLLPQNSKSRTTFAQAHKINFGTKHKHKFYVYARKQRFMFTCINTKLILGLLHSLNKIISFHCPSKNWFDGTLYHSFTFTFNRDETKYFWRVVIFYMFSLVVHLLKIHKCPIIPLVSLEAWMCIELFVFT